jgi:hypothetical protein
MEKEVNIWRNMFYDLLDEVAQIPHPMAEDILADFIEQAKEEEEN